MALQGMPSMPSISDISIGSKMGFNNASYFDQSSTKLGEVKLQLDSASEKDKLEGMKRLIAMMSKGRDVSSMFPDVVKNVVSKSLEVKKLVYMYLVHYAELEPDAALLAINSFQKAMSDQNQLIRASALRVMSSIRVVDIVQLIVMAIEKAVKDSSPYVRKAAAHAIPKVYSLDPEKKEHLTNIVGTLLADNSTMVLGSAVAAFTEVCPDQLDLIHPHYRKLCRLVADVDEWGQVFIINMLTKYARTQFTCPDSLLLDAKKQKDTKKKSFYESEEDEEGNEKGGDEQSNEMDQDYRLLLRSTLPLLQSRNNAVVMAVSSLYFYLAPTVEATKIGKALVRLLRANREVQFVALTNIASMACQRPSLFEAQIAEFFVSSSDPEFVRELKLDILTSIANESNIGRILREFKDYVKSEDKSFVTATIQAIGRCASNIPEVTESCMNGLMALVSNPTEAVVAESVVVIKTLLQKMAANIAEVDSTEKERAQRQHRSVVRQLARILDNITVPAARASIIWVIGEYCDRIPLIAPDTLRKLAKTFPDEDDQVKFQILNLGAKLFVHNPDQTSAIFHYVLALAKFDQSYDLRDRARMLRVLLLNKDEKANNLHEKSRGIVVNAKPAPVATSVSEDRQRFILGSLSHTVNHSVLGYEALPDFPTTAPNPSVRQSKEEPRWDNSPSVPRKPESWWDDSVPEEQFYSDEEHEGSDKSYDSEEEEEERGRARTRSGSSSASDRSDSRTPSGSRSRSRSRSDDSYSDSYSYSSEEEKEKEKKSQPPKPAPKPTVTSKPAAKTAAKPAPKTSKPASSPSPSNDLDDLFNFSSSSSSTPQASNDLLGLDLSRSSNKSLTSSYTPISPSSFATLSTPITASTTPQPRKILLKHVVGGGLEIEYTFLRRSTIGGSGPANSNTVQLVFRNHQPDKTISDIRVGKTSLPPGMELTPFPTIPSLFPSGIAEQILTIHFPTLTQPAKFEICTDKGNFPVTLPPAVGELVSPYPISPEEFNDEQKRLSGMHETSEPVSVETEDGVQQALRTVSHDVLDASYVSPIFLQPERGIFRFAGKTMTDGGIVLLSVELDPNTARGKCTVNCENAIFATTLLKRIVQALVE